MDLQPKEAGERADRACTKNSLQCDCEPGWFGHTERGSEGRRPGEDGESEGKRREEKRKRD